MSAADPPSILVLADDLTGANATGAALSRSGMRVISVAAGRLATSSTSAQSRFDAVIVNTDSRHATAAEAESRVVESVRQRWPVEFVSKRVDSTLRGNIGTEACAALRVVAELSGRRVVGLCLPAHPAAGRCTVAGQQLLHGRRLEETELAKDPRNPIRTSSVADTLASGTELNIATLDLRIVTGTPQALVDALQTATDRGADIVIADALTEEHLDQVAVAASQLAGRDQHLMWLGIDPGPGTLALTRALRLQRQTLNGPVLAISGSSTDLTCTQLHYLVTQRHVTVIHPPPPTVGGTWPDVEATARAVTTAVTTAKAGEVVLLATFMTEQDILDATVSHADTLSSALGRIVRLVLESAPVSALFTNGGDATTAVLKHIGAGGLEIEDEVEPLAVSGWAFGGPWSGMPIVTKGGLVGNPQTILACISKAEELAKRRSSPRQHLNRELNSTVPS